MGPPVVALGEPPSGDGPRPLLAIGEVKWGRTLGRPDLDRLVRARELLTRRPGVDASAGCLLLASGNGLTEGLRELAAGRAEVALVDPERLYQCE
ncbi:hypothetical protein O7606_17305 [Micromonospora sp. WMMD882]|uniref:hypothetical protein n=1 Tax=Micromonospora sp. WMMD882 TaxID=3015151 RepID=UPI00248BAC3E|nr:hypothetical protein [Micromonospora sp. WMMD882]WBB78003.1 hypothetical protein O7606_17305 [Micromonospora sp. WMMD882]